MTIYMQDRRFILTIIIAIETYISPFAVDTYSAIMSATQQAGTYKVRRMK